MRQRNKSINLVKPHKMQSMNQNTYLNNPYMNTPESRNNHIKASPIMSKQLQNFQLNSANKYKPYPTKDMSYIKKGPKQFSLNITSIQSPEQKAVYIKEKQDQRVLISNSYNSSSATSGKNLSPAFTLYTESSYNSNSNLNSNQNSNSPQISNNTKMVVKFLVEQFGQEKVDELLFLLHNSQNPMEFLNGDGRDIESIVGEKFKIAQNFLKKIVIENPLVLNKNEG